MQRRLAIIGATGFATERMIPQILRQKNAIIVAIQGRNEIELQRICKEFNIAGCYTDIEEILTKSKPDVVYVCTPPYRHTEDLEAVFKHKIPVICEKPLAQSLQMAKKIEKLYKKYKSPLFILGHHMRHQQAVSDIKSLIESKEIGEAVFVQGQWGYELDPQSKLAKWKFKEDLGGKSVFDDPGIHIIDLCLALFGKPQAAIAYGFSVISGETYDNASCILEYPKLSISLNNSQTMSAAQNDLFIYGTKGKICVPGGISQESISRVEITSPKGSQIKEYSSVNLYAAEVDALFGKESGLPPTSFKEAMIGMQILEAIHKSIKTRKRCKI